MEKNILQGPKLSLPRKTLGQYFFDSAEKFADRTCQIDASTDQRDTFATLSRRSVRVALEMQHRGVTSKHVILQCSSSTLNSAVPLIAAFYLGATIGNLDVSLSVRHVTHLLSLVSPRMIFVEETAVDLIEQSLEGATFETELVVIGNSTKYTTFSEFETSKDNEEAFAPIAVDLEESAIICFSSGTTGLPKAICHSNSSFLSVALCFYNSSARLEISLSFTSFYWITAMLFLCATFIGGGHRVICGNQVDPAQTYRAIEKYKITCMFLAPVLSFALTTFENHHKYDVSSLSSLLTSGTPLSTAQYNALRTIFKHSNILGCYGQSETGVISVLNPATDRELIVPKSKSSGKVIAGITLKVVDIETDQILGPKQTGEIRVQSSSVMKGYHNGDSSSCFAKDGFLRTGDIGYFDEDGCLYVVERWKEMFKYLSWHIVPSAIEAVLYEHPAIAEVVVFGLPGSEEEGEVPAACVVKKQGCSVSTEEIEEFVARRVSDRERLRGGVFFESELLKTPSAKLMRREIRDKIIKSMNK